MAECVGIFLSLWGTMDVAAQQENMNPHDHPHNHHI